MRLLVAPGRRALAHASRSLGAVAAAASSDPTLADLVARTRAASRGPPSSTSSSLCVHGSDTAAEAVRFEPHAPPRVVTTTTAALGLPPRDAAVLRPPSASGGGQRATQVAREVGAGSAIDGDALILVRTEAVRAAVGARNRAVVRLLTDAQLDRYEAYRRASISRPAVRRVRRGDDRGRACV